MRHPASKSRKQWKKGRIVVTVTQSTRARTGQGGNVFAINASDVGVVRTDIRSR